MARIKREPGSGLLAANGNTTPARQSRHSAVTPRSAVPSRPAPSAPSSSAVSPEETRGLRSDAPTVDTRAIAPELSVPSGTYDPDIVMMEVRPAPVKQEAGDDQHNRMQAPEAGDIDKNLKDIGQHLKSFNDTLGSLQSLGIHHDTPLPELILVGDQSSGKSSLMSAISQIILPRSDGVCTRCPVHIRLSSDTTWRCRVSIQQDYAYCPPNNEPITEADVTEHNPFPPWIKQSREVKEFKMVYNKTDPIDEIVRWAQIAILNHNRNFAQYVPKDWDLRTQEEKDPEYEARRLAEAERATEAKFSPNTVAIEVKGPGLPDLSFYDMPGVFRNAKHEEDQFLVKVVENLVRSYISHEKALILWAVPMNHDPETSSTYALVRNLHAQQRTIGVMTKADLLPPGGHTQWLEMLAGHQHRVGHNYFITSRAPPTVQNGDDHELQRRDRQSLRDEHAAEEAFFNRATGSWPEEFHSFEDRCGIDHLVKFLAQTLAQEFARNLPDLAKQLNEKLTWAKDQLARLPEMPQNPEYEIRKSLLKFTNVFQSRLKGKKFHTSWAEIATAFKAKVLDLKPRYRVIPEGFAMDRNGMGSSISDRDSVFSVNNSPSLSAKRVRNFLDLTNDGPPFTPAAQRRRGENGSVIKVEENIASPFQTPSSTSAVAGRIPSKSLGQIRSLIRSEREAGKPGEVPYDIMEKLCMEAVKTWEGPLKTFLDHTMTQLRRELEASLNESFKDLKKRQVFRDAKKYTTEWLHAHKKRILDDLHRNYKLETTKVYTTDEDTFDRHRAHEAQMLRRTRHFYRWKHYNNDTSAERLEDWDTMTAESRRKEEDKFQKEQVRLGEDEYSAELDLAARVRGYYLTAATRFTDVTAMHITSGLFPDLIDDIEMYLDKAMGLAGGAAYDADVFVRLMEEEKSTAEKRVELKARVGRFDRAVNEIQELIKTVMQASAPAQQPNNPQPDISMEDMEGEYDGYDGD
ncbi:Interferon-induced GTP-binding protein Mx [Cytospora mali]|uniref:Interferon-induced GTP-binding protein Mx n=1 Tax=Cytospora mali TaxID=578113 RepID=A0A194WB60_CYTMA|nr:Interferon-induced GTP-binding protein Mx [Valsa mali]